MDGNRPPSGLEYLQATGSPPRNGEDFDLIDRPRFMTFDKPAVGVSPAIFHDPIAADLSNVVVPFVLSEAQRA